VFGSADCEASVVAFPLGIAGTKGEEMTGESTTRRSQGPRPTRLGGLGILLLAAAYLIARPMFLEPAPPVQQPAATAPQAAAEPAALPLGELTDLPDGVKRSAAGLLYTPGSREGHRLTHVLRHGDDQPLRPGLHGVFDGDDDDLLTVIDEAYLLVQAGSPQVQSRREGQRTVHEVDLRRRIGFVGGQEGRRRGNPPATHVRLVLEDDRVITAFPF
jgi:hypothetical protein